jgi:DNA-binding SARP family transcriptional activator/DNA-binding CsgD family transcriptional regulator/tetratricopeptide (TPR) repeat protein
MVQVRLLGPVDVVVDGESRPVRGLRRKAVLSVLALHRGEIVSTGRLIDVVWGGVTASIVANTLQSHVSHLRRVLGSRTSIQARPPGYVLDLGDDRTDVEAAEELIERGSRMTDLGQRASQMQAALELWRGPPMIDVAGVVWLDEQAQRLDQLWLRATRALIEARLALGEHAGLVPVLEGLAREHPLDEQVQGLLILALFRSGRQADALAVYRRLRGTLGDELGIDPSQALRDLEAAILRQDPALQAPSPPIALPALGGSRPPEPAGPERTGPETALSGTALTEPEYCRVGSPGVRLGAATVVGRPAELMTLRTAVEAASRGGGGSLFLLGEAGIGKTRLAAETTRFAEHMGLNVLRGRAAPGVQFRPLSEALLSVLRRSGPPEDRDLLPYRPALSRLVPEWRGEPGLDDSLVVLAEAVLRLIITLGRPRGCVLVLEDLHDADADTLAVIDYLLDNARQERLLVVGTARTDPSPALELIRAAQHRRTAGVVELTRLDDNDVRCLAGGCLDVAPEQVPEPVVRRLLASADGVPLYVEELLAGMVSDGVLVRAADHWVVEGLSASQIPVSLAATLAGRADRLGPAAARVLAVAALLGRQFPVATAGTAAGVDATQLLACVREAVEAQLLVPQSRPELYAFRHVLTAEALRARMLPLERVALSRRAAESVEASAPPSWDGWEQLAGELWSVAGEPRRAATQFSAAGRRACAQGAVSTGISLLERALSIMDSVVTDDEVIDVGEALVGAYAEAGRISDAYALGARFDGHAVPGRRAAAHLRLARVAAAAGDWQQGLREVASVRQLLGRPPDPALSARVDAVAAELTFGSSTAGRQRAARLLAERALRSASATGQPDVSCSALETLGRCARLRDLAEADALYKRGLAVAEEHGLVSWQITMLFHIGADDGIRDADTSRLAEAFTVANQAGAVVTALDIELEASIVWLCRGEFAKADAATLRGEETAARLRLTHTRLIALGERIMVAAHRGRQSEVDTLLTRFRELGGEEDEFFSAVQGLGLAFCHLFHEEGELARVELAEAVRQEAHRPTSYLSLIHGPHLLLSVLDGQAGRAECVALADSAQVEARWNRQFLVLAEALLHGRDGRMGPADAAMARFMRLSEPYPSARHLGLRLVAPDAIAGGWGDPVSWLRMAEAHFHGWAPPVTRACRNLLRLAGAPAPQHRRGSDTLPPAIRERGITVREYEVLGLIVGGLANQEIGTRLFLSTRTVEKHVANLLAKTKVEDRARLVAFAERLTAPLPGS